jgi:ribosomal protein RSM22 (predicted rRNA methylase)
MQLPPHMRRAIEGLAERFGLAELRDAAERLSAAYQGKLPTSRFSSDVDRIAYLLVRFPATYAACQTALGYVAVMVPPSEISSLLDLGSGPGTAVAAAAAVFPGISRIEAIERDPGIARLSEEILHESLRIEQQNADLANAEFSSADLVTMAYALGEIASSQRAEVIARAWAATQRLLVVIEPGTPEGYERVLRTREQILAAGGNVVAPCPHHARCPMVGTRDWCHFSARIERTSLHRRLKRGTLGHEDEKFSYVAFGRDAVNLPPGRVVRHPVQSPGLVRLQLCVDGKALREEVVARSNKDTYKAARRADWGDAWPPILECDGR